MSAQQGLNWFKRHIFVTVGIVFALGFFIGVGAGASGDLEDTADVAEATDDEPTSEEAPEVEEEPEVEPEEPEEPAVAPDPDGTIEYSCDYLLGDFTENPDSGYRFIADGTVENTGNIGVRVKATARWLLAGGGAVKDSKEVSIPYGRTKRISFSVGATSDEIDRHQSLGGTQTGEGCKVGVTILDTFGEPVG